MTLGAFDRDLSLAELLSDAEQRAVAEALETLFGPGARLLNTAGRPLGNPDAAGVDAAVRVPLAVDIEPLGYVEAAAPDARVGQAARLVTLLLRANGRYRMASELHLEATHEDYTELQRRHEALQASEARYRELAAQLEQRVAEQVKTIEATQQRLYQNEKLAAVGQLAAGIAHEINNPMGFVKSNLRTAADYLEALRRFGAHLARAEVIGEVRNAWREADLDYVMDDFTALVRESLGGVERVSRIVADLKGFSRVDESGYEWNDLNEVVRQVATVSQSRIENHAVLQLALGDGLPACLCNGAQIGEVLYNLLDNALRAVANGGTIRIGTETQADGVLVSVTDNGCGMPPEVKARLFEPFFSTRGVGEGTGLGLSVASDIVRGHGGRIEVTSVPNKGSRFTIWLPRQARSITDKAVAD